MDKVAIIRRLDLAREVILTERKDATALLVTHIKGQPRAEFDYSGMSGNLPLIAADILKMFIDQHGDCPCATLAAAQEALEILAPPEVVGHA